MGDYKIIVDAGHGGEDPGAVSGNLKEKDFIPLVTGLIICISGLGKLQSSAIAVRIGYSNALIYFLLSVVSIVFGVWVMFFVQGMFAAKTVFMLIGAGLLFSGLSDLFVTVFLSAKYTSYVKKFEREHNIIDAEVVDEKEEKEYRAGQIL